MSLLILGLAIFFIVHASTMARGARAGLVQRFGEGTYKGAYSGLSLLGIVLVVWGFVQYRGAGLMPMYAPPAFRLPLASASKTCLGETPYDFNFNGSTSTWYCFVGPPNPTTSTMPGTVRSRRSTTQSSSALSSSGEKPAGALRV